MGLKLAGIMMIVMMAMGGIGYWYYTDTQKRMVILVANEAKATLAVQESEKAKKVMEENFKRVTQELKEVNDKFATIRASNNVLSQKLQRHDLGVLANKKPGLVQKIINRATVNANRCFEIESGAKLTEKEKNAKTGKAFNNECPWLWSGASTP
jgi:hypothetical protein|tara:strand:- start:73 stop:534 length:462 start_codon:yes stop_codon:yes gene_type:complete